MSFDTTVSNTGVNIGAYVLLEKKNQKKPSKFYMSITHIGPFWENVSYLYGSFK